MRKLQLSNSNKDLAKVTLAGVSRDENTGGLTCTAAHSLVTLHYAYCVLNSDSLEHTERAELAETEFSLHGNLCETTSLHSCNNPVLCWVLAWFPLTPRKPTVLGTGAPCERRPAGDLLAYFQGGLILYFSKEMSFLHLVLEILSFILKIALTRIYTHRKPRRLKDSSGMRRHRVHALCIRICLMSKEITAFALFLTQGAMASLGQIPCVL